MGSTSPRPHLKALPSGAVRPQVSKPNTPTRWIVDPGRDGRPRCMTALTCPLHDRKASGRPPGLRGEGGAHLVASIVERPVPVRLRAGGIVGADPQAGLGCQIVQRCRKPSMSSPVEIRSRGDSVQVGRSPIIDPALALLRGIPQEYEPDNDRRDNGRSRSSQHDRSGRQVHSATSSLRTSRRKYPNNEPVIVATVRTFRANRTVSSPPRRL